jgi:rare lipoprotein A (peptidoglycan hydrolase)
MPISPAMVALVGLLALPTTVHANLASWYSVADNGTTTASGIPFSDHKNTCAHKTHKFGTKLQVTNTRNGKTTTCVVTDRGPYIKGRVVDLSPVGASALGMKASGLAPVQIAVVTDPFEVDHQPLPPVVEKQSGSKRSKPSLHRGSSKPRYHKVASRLHNPRPETSVRDAVLNSLRNLHSN